MAKQKYKLNPEEKIVFKVGNVRHGFWGSYTNTLIVTNQGIIFEQYGMFNNFKGITLYKFVNIHQAIIGKATNGERQLELYLTNGEVLDFAIQTQEENVLKTLIMAINDQMSEDAQCYDYEYYSRIMKGSNAANRMIDRRAMGKAKEDQADIDLQNGLSFVGDVAKNMLKSGDISMKGLTKGINKASKKQARDTIFGGVMDELLDDLGIYDIQDAFTEFGNDIREDLGLKPKMTHEERRELIEREEELIEQEEQMKKAEIERLKSEAYERQVEKAKKQIAKKESDSYGEAKQNRLSINDQLDALKKLKKLLDMGVVTQEEFEIKKKEIMDL